MPMGGFSIRDFKENFQTGARSYLFVIDPVFPNGVNVTNKERSGYYVRSSSLPSSNFDDITTSWQGFDFKSAGKRNYDPLTISFNVDKDAYIREAYANWQNQMLNPETNIASYPSQYMVNQKIYLLGLDFLPIMTFELFFAYPQSVGEVSLDYTNSDFATFDVGLTYTYFTAVKGGAV